MIRLKIFNAEIHTMDSKNTIIPNGYIEITNGKITAVAEGPAGP